MKPTPSPHLTALLAEPFESDLAQAHTLSARWYTDPELHALELERVFSRTWQPVGSAAQVAHAGDYFTADIAGRPVVVVRDEGEELRAFYNVCRHRAGPVAVGCGRRKSLQCAYHGWTYKLNGALATTPEFDGVQCFYRAENGLRPVQVATWGPFVFVNLDANAGSLLDFLGGIPAAAAKYDLDALTYTDRREWTFDCNWKVYMDNYHEGYHLPMVHPGLFREVDYSRYETRIFPTYEQQDAPLRPKSGAKDADGSRMYDGNGEALYYGVFPNWMLNIYPDNISINIVMPAGVGRTHTLFEWYFRDPSKKESIARSIAFSEEIQEEDIRICLAVQRGLASGAYDRGRFCVKREAAVHHFQSLVHSYVTRE